MAAWLFQIQPRKYRIFDAVEDGETIDGLSARQHRDEIATGDDAVLWIARSPGRDAGVYAIGTVTHPRFSGRADRYWTDPPQDDSFVGVRLDQNVFHYPVDRQILANDRDFADARILKVPNETTQLLAPEEWAAIERRVLAHGPTRRPSLTRPQKP